MKSPSTWLKTTLAVFLLALAVAVPVFNAPAKAACDQQDLFCGAKGEACSAVNATDSSGSCDQGKLDQGQTTLSTTLTTLLNLLTMIVGIMSIIMIIISGIRFVTAAGDSNHISSAKNTFIYALVGLIIVAFAQIIVKLVLTRIS